MGNGKGPDEVFCRSCGEPIKKKAAICPNCGVRNEYDGGQPAGGATTQTRSRGGRSQSAGATASGQSQSPADQVSEFFSSPEESDHDPTEHSTTASGNWHYGVVIGVALMGLGLAIPTENPAAGGVLLLGWILLPLAVYVDHQYLKATTKWRSDLKLWIPLMIIPFVNMVAGIAYLIRRNNVSKVTRADAGFTMAQEQNDPALETLRERYSRGELTDEEFEQKVEQIVGTESQENAEIHVRSDSSETDTEQS